MNIRKSTVAQNKKSNKKKYNKEYYFYLKLLKATNGNDKNIKSDSK